MFHASITVDVTVNEKAPGHDLACFEAAMSRFAHLEKRSLVFSSSLFAVLVNLCHPERSSIPFVFLPQIFSTPGHVHFKILFYLKVTLYNPQNYLIS